MKSLREVIADAESKKVALGHFNVSDSVQLNAVVQAGKNQGVPVLIGVSEGEREFLGVKQIAALIRSIREEYNFPTPSKSLRDYMGQVYLNADHTHSLDKIEEAARAGFDAVIADGSKLPFEENIAFTREAVQRAKRIAPDILVEGELGYIGSGSSVLKEMPEGAAVSEKDFTKPEDAERFVKETGVDLFAPAVGNIHGMLADRSEPHLDIDRITAIRKAAGVPLVLHGGSGTPDEDFVKAIDVGIAVIHISTELRVAWRRSLEETLQRDKEEVAPYKVLEGVVRAVGRVVEARLRLFNRLNER